MKHKLNYTDEVASKLTTLSTYFFHSQSQRAKAAMYLAAGSFVFA